jgi:ABC-type glycerol-3-phosphate transport system substrate-binding protein
VSRWILPLAALAALSACGGDSMGGATPATPAAPAATDFTAFVLDLLKSQSDAAEPVAVNTAQFVFRDDDTPAAFATALGGT